MHTCSIIYVNALTGTSISLGGPTNIIFGHLTTASSMAVHSYDDALDSFFFYFFFIIIFFFP